MNHGLYSPCLFSAVLFAAACASGVAASTSEGRRETSLGNPDREQYIRRSCGASNTSAAPADGVLADFAGKKGQVITFVPPGAPATTSLTHVMDSGKHTVNVNAIPGAKPQFLTMTVLFDDCIDATGFAGVQFNVSGSLSGCALVYASVDPEHQYRGPEGPYPPQTRIPVADLSSQSHTIKAPFRDPGIQGNPATPVDPSKIAFIQWLVIVPVGGSIDGRDVPSCNGSVVVDDIKLYR